MALVSAFLEVLNRPTVGDVMLGLMAFMAPLWMAVVVGVLIGWVWKPRWAKLNVDFLDCSMIKGESSKSMAMLSQVAASFPNLSSLKLQVPSCISRVSDLGAEMEKESSSLPSISSTDRSEDLVNVCDLKHLHKLVEGRDGGPDWVRMMDKSTENMHYQAWRRDPATGPPQYRSRSVYEDATPEMLRDFFWDDEFRLKWDDMLVHAETLKECPVTGTMMVRWVRKFPFFCSDREYIIGRRIWKCGQSFYCVTKGVLCSSVPRLSKPRRVDSYYSSWCIRAVESKRDGRETACEVLLFHHEDMGIPWEIAKFGVWKGMWGAVKKIDPGLRAYQELRASMAPISPSAKAAQINTKMDVDSLDTAAAPEATNDSKHIVDSPSGRAIPKILIVAGAVAAAYTLDRGLLTKGFVFAVARRFVGAGRGL
ncbi:uncharacterized protein LOC127263885 [Andrographis paniculata]|uniref:uncharacterized protein LOC127263885 n=1 Tax=Andrographis paniculata TaxID=175694 RepID=UPI0021E88EE5|nr:uncharacterized protein LOC127263885 [Andrographis paniculata]